VLREREAVPREDLVPVPEPALSPVLPDLLRAVPERADPVAPDFARDDVDLLPLLVERDADPLDFAAEERLLVDREPVEREPVDADRARAPLPRDDVPDDEDDDEDRELLPPESSSEVHLPDITRCAASATASAINDPSLVALDITLLAA